MPEPREANATENAKRRINSDDAVNADDDGNQSSEYDLCNITAQRKPQPRETKTKKLGVCNYQHFVLWNPLTLVLVSQRAFVVERWNSVARVISGYDNAAAEKVWGSGRGRSNTSSNVDDFVGRSLVWLNFGNWDADRERLLRTRFLTSFTFNHLCVFVCDDASSFSQRAFLCVCVCVFRWEISLSQHSRPLVIKSNAAF